MAEFGLPSLDLPGLQGFDMKKAADAAQKAASIGGLFGAPVMGPMSVALGYINQGERDKALGYHKPSIPGRAARSLIPSFMQRDVLGTLGQLGPYQQALYDDAPLAQRQQGAKQTQYMHMYTPEERELMSESELGWDYDIADPDPATSVADVEGVAGVTMDSDEHYHDDPLDEAAEEAAEADEEAGFGEDSGWARGGLVDEDMWNGVGSMMNRRMLELANGGPIDNGPHQYEMFDEGGEEPTSQEQAADSILKAVDWLGRIDQSAALAEQEMKKRRSKALSLGPPKGQLPFQGGIGKFMRGPMFSIIQEASLAGWDALPEEKKTAIKNFLKTPAHELFGMSKPGIEYIKDWLQNISGTDQQTGVTTLVSKYIDHPAFTGYRSFPHSGKEIPAGTEEPGYYYTANRAFLKTDLKKGTPQQWLNRFTDGGTTEDEIKYRKIAEKLKEASGNNPEAKISRAQVGELLSEKVPVVTVIKRGGGTDVMLPDFSKYISNTDLDLRNTEPGKPAETWGISYDGRGKPLSRSHTKAHSMPPLTAYKDNLLMDPRIAKYVKETRRQEEYVGSPTPPHRGGPLLFGIKHYGINYLERYDGKRLNLGDNSISIVGSNEYGWSILDGKNNIWFSSVLRQRPAFIELIPTLEEAKVQALAMLRDNPAVKQQTGRMGTEPTLHSSSQVPGGENYREREYKVDEKIASVHTNFLHWPDDKNIIVHARMNDRSMKDFEPVKQQDNVNLGFLKQKFYKKVGADTWKKLTSKLKKVLLLEETQSDHHQAGQKKGYIEPRPPLQSIEDRDAWQIRLDRLQEGAVEHAPFEKTWDAMAFRLLLAEAVEDGYDAIALPNPYIQIERWAGMNELDFRNFLTRFNDVKAAQVGMKSPKNDKEIIREVYHSLYSDPNILSLLPSFERAMGLYKFYGETFPRSVSKIAEKNGGELIATTMNIPRSKRSALRGRAQDLGKPLKQALLVLSPSMKAKILKEGVKLFGPAGKLAAGGFVDKPLYDQPRMIG